MNIMRQRVVTTASPTDANALVGSAFEYPQQPSQVSLGMICTATGMLATVYAGSRLIMEESPVAQPSTFIYPIVPDHMYLNYPVLPGERLVVQLRNASAGNLTVGVNCEITPVG